MTIAPGCDAYVGKFDISVEPGELDVVIVGAGLAGLSSAFHLLQKHPNARILLLEANSYASGNAARDEEGPLRVPASIAGAFCTVPDGGFMHNLYRELGIEGEKFKIASPRTTYFFDKHAPGVKPDYRGWQTDEIFSPGRIRNPPNSEKIMDDFARSFKAPKV